MAGKRNTGATDSNCTIFLALISKLFLPRSRQNIYLVAIIIVAATAASGGPLIGITMSEWHLVTLYLCAVCLILKPFAIDDAFVLTKPRLKNVLVAGVLRDWRLA